MDTPLAPPRPVMKSPRASKFVIGHCMHTTTLLYIVVKVKLYEYVVYHGRRRTKFILGSPMGGRNPPSLHSSLAVAVGEQQAPPSWHALWLAGNTTKFILSSPMGGHEPPLSPASSLTNWDGP